jgi:hypothetical protein
MNTSPPGYLANSTRREVDAEHRVVGAEEYSSWTGEADELSFYGERMSPSILLTLLRWLKLFRLMPVKTSSTKTSLLQGWREDRQRPKRATRANPQTSGPEWVNWVTALRGPGWVRPNWLLLVTFAWESGELGLGYSVEPCPASSAICRSSWPRSMKYYLKQSMFSWGW